MQNIYLTDLIDASMLQRVQDAFSNMVGMAALTTDETGHPVTEGSNFTDYCMKYTRTSRLGRMRCEGCDRYGAIKTHETGRPTYYTCHSGLIDFAAPIMANGTMIGSFIGGQVLTSPPDKETVRKIAKEIEVDFDKFWTAIQKVPVVSEERIKLATEALYSVASVLSELAVGKYTALRANEEIARIAQMKTDFLANMSHEIRTPMNAIIGMSEMALRENLPDSTRSYIRQIKSSGRALLTIINDILDFSKIESGKMEINPVDYDVMSLFNDVSTIIMTRLVDKEVFLDLDIDPNLPCLLHGDNIRIRQVLINLANNAVKFTNEGCVAIRVGFDRIDDERIMLKVTVDDTGIGIREEDLSKIFESFSQVDSTRNRNVEGTGLGLAIALKLLNLMGGEMHVKSEYGKGSSFGFTVPQTVVKHESAMKLKTQTKKIALGLMENEYLTSAFSRDCKKLGVQSVNLAKSVNLEKGIENLKGKYGSDTEVFVFLSRNYLTDSVKEFISEHKEVNAVLVSDFDVEAKLDVPHLRIVKLPLSCMNLSMIFNKDKISFENSTSHDDDIDFIAPDVHVLIVDDNLVNLTVAEGLLEPLKLKISTAQSGPEAIKKAKENKFDLILMDHMMPGMDGIEATKRIREECPGGKKIPILALTANAVEDAREQFRVAGMNDFIAKPVEVHTLVKKLKQWIPADRIRSASDANAFGYGSEYEAVADLDVPYAIELLGSEKLFHKVLGEYHRTIASKAALIESTFKAQDWANFVVEVHALKSASCQIGALQLGDSAGLLEKAAKSGDISYIKENTAKVLEKYRQYEEVLASFDVSVDADGKQKAPASVVSAQCARIKEAAQNLDVDVLEEACSILQKYSYSVDEKRILDSLVVAVRNFDMGACASLAQELDSAL